MKFGLIYSLLILLFLCGCATTQSLKNPIIRLVTNDGKTYCSGFVISDSLAMTAAHCLTPFLSNVIVSDENLNSIMLAEVIAVDDRTDQVLLRGNFTTFQKFKLKRNTNGIEGSKGPFLSCGYSYGGKLQCYNYVNEGSDLFMLKGIGFLYSGMSGGPLYDTSTGEVVGINHAVKESYSLHSPLVNTRDRYGF